MGVTTTSGLSPRSPWTTSRLPGQGCSQPLCTPELGGDRQASGQRARGAPCSSAIWSTRCGDGRRKAARCSWRRWMESWGASAPLLCAGRGPVLSHRSLRWWPGHVLGDILADGLSTERPCSSSLPLYRLYR